MTANKASLAAVQRIVIPWTSNSGGAASVTIDNVNGTILRVQFVPGTGGNQPNANYDVTLLDDAGEDVLRSQGTDLSNATPSSVCPGTPLKDGTTVSTVPTAVEGTLTLLVAGAGSVRSGVVNLFVR